MDIGNLEVDLRAKRLQIASLKAELVEHDPPDAPAASTRMIFEHWQKHCRPRAKLDAARTKIIRARMRDGFTPLQLCLAIDGAAVDAFVNAKGKRFDDLELIMRDAGHVEDFIRRGELHDDRRGG